jgi:hypothetical protein
MTKLKSTPQGAAKGLVNALSLKRNNTSAKANPLAQLIVESLNIKAKAI